MHCRATLTVCKRNGATCLAMKADLLNSGMQVTRVREARKECADDELICFNRTNRRDKFYRDWHPYFYISYSRVLCYPASWEGEGGCSSCSPGRYCRHEKRCIADETMYCCEGEWGSVCGQEGQQEGQRDYGLGLELEADQFT